MGCGSSKDQIAELAENFFGASDRDSQPPKELDRLELWSYYPQTAAELLRLFPFYGYWKDIFLIMELGIDYPFSKQLERGGSASSIDPRTLVQGPYCPR
jgi:hypothetical protein